MWMEAEIYINFASDTIWPLGQWTMKSFEDFCKRDIQHIAVTISPFEDPEDLPASMVQDQEFDYLRVKTLTICHPSCFDPRVPIDFEAFVVKDQDHSQLSPKDSHYGLVSSFSSSIKHLQEVTRHTS